MDGAPFLSRWVPAGPSLRYSFVNVLQTLRICGPTIADAARGRLDKSASDRRLDHWSRRLLENGRVTLQVFGRENLPKGACIVMSNHQSLYDIPAVFQTIGPSLRMVAKAELFRIPIFGRALMLGGFIPIDRRNRKHALESLRRAKEALSAGVPIWIAPEGTRSPDGSLLPFKKGGFYLSADTGAPILPVSLRGTRRVLPSRGIRSTADETIEVVVHPLRPAPTSRRSLEPLMQEIAETIAQGLR